MSIPIRFRPALIGLAGVLLIGGALAVVEYKGKTTEQQHSAPEAIGIEARDSGKLLELSWLGVPSFPGGRNDLWIQQMLEKEFNLEIEPIFMDPNGYDRKKPLMLSGGTIPDVIWEADPLTLQRAVHHRFIAELPYELIRQHAPTVFAEIREHAPIAWLYSNVGGRNYGLPTKNMAGLRPRPGIWRMDWLRNVGIDKVPDTLEEFEEALRRLTFADPNRSGSEDTFGMSGDISHWWWASFSEIFGAYGVLPFDWQVIDGEVVWGGVHPRSKEALGVLRRWFAEGLIHPDFVTDNSMFGQSLERKFFAGSIGYIYYRALHNEMDTRPLSSFYSRFLNLQMANLLRSEDGLLTALLQRLPRKMIEDLKTLQVAHLLNDLPQVLRGELLESFAQHLELTHPANSNNELHLKAVEHYLGNISEDVRLRILNHDLKLGFEFDTLRPGPVPALRDFNEQDRLYLMLPPEDGRMPYQFRQILLPPLRQMLINRMFEAFPEDTRSVVEQAMSERVVAAFLMSRPTGGDSWVITPGRVDEVVTGIASGRYNYLLSEFRLMLLQSMQNPRAQELNANLLNLLWDDYRWQLHFGNFPAVLAVGRFPEGPYGDRGARVWGAGGNIITFGQQVVDNPEIAVRVLKMFEAFYTDKYLYRETFSGRQGVHWEWSDPEVGQGSGIAFSRNFLNHETGEVVDLQAGNSAHRLMLSHDSAFFNPVGSTEEIIRYFANRNTLEFDEQHRSYEWALVNALGKSDVVPSASRYLGDLRTRQQTVYAEILRGDRPLEYFDEFVSNWYSRGGEVLTQEARELYGKKKAIFAELEVTDNE